jgi:phosphatidylglycerophosphatase A
MTRDEQRMFLGFHSTLSDRFLKEGEAALVLTPQQFLEVVHHPGTPQRTRAGIVQAIVGPNVLLKENEKTCSEALQTVFPITRLQHTGSCKNCRYEMNSHGVTDSYGNIVPDEMLGNTFLDHSHAALCNALFAYLVCRAFGLCEEQDAVVDFVIDCLILLV